MYYKIKNQNSEAYKKLHEMRSKELRFEEENKTAINEKVGLEWTQFLGHSSQQTIIMFFGEDYNIESEDIIEITKSEFSKIHETLEKSKN